MLRLIVSMFSHLVDPLSDTLFLDKRRGEVRTIKRGGSDMLQEADRGSNVTITTATEDPGSYILVHTFLY